MAALSGLVYFCEQLPHEARAGHLLPLARRHMQPLELELPLQRTLADAYPRLLAAVSDRGREDTVAAPSLTLRLPWPWCDTDRLRLRVQPGGLLRHVAYDSAGTKHRCRYT